MKTGSVMKLLKAGKQFSKKHAPEIMIAFGIGSMVMAIGSAIHDTPKAIANIEEAEREKGEPLTKTEIVKATWKCYIPTAVSFAIGTGCLIGANSVSTRRTAAMAAAYKISETALHDLKNAVTETVDEAKVKEIREKVSKKQVERAKNSGTGTIVVGSGDVLCYDPLSDRLFTSSENKIRAAENQVMWKVNHEMYSSLNDFYTELGLRSTEVGDMMGWNHDHPIDITFDSGLTDDGKPYMSIEYLIPPIHEFDKLY